MAEADSHGHSLRCTLTNIYFPYDPYILLYLLLNVYHERFRLSLQAYLFKIVFAAEGLEIVEGEFNRGL